MNVKRRVLYVVIPELTPFQGCHYGADDYRTGRIPSLFAAPRGHPIAKKEREVCDS